MGEYGFALVHLLELEKWHVLLAAQINTKVSHDMPFNHSFICCLVINSVFATFSGYLVTSPEIQGHKPILPQLRPAHNPGGKHSTNLTDFIIHVKISKQDDEGCGNYD